MKICSKCKKKKSYIAFHRDVSNKDGFRYDCKKCRSNKLKSYYKLNNLAIKNQKKEYYCNNSESILSQKSKYYIKNKSKIITRINLYHKNRLKTNMNYKLRCTLRTRLNSAIKGNQKTGSAVKDLGCSIEEFKAHLESQFTIGMNWDNHGEWHIDHIKPLSKFDLTNPEELKQACHFSNLQPLWAKDNLRKGSK